MSDITNSNKENGMNVIEIDGRWYDEGLNEVEAPVALLPVSEPEPEIEKILPRSATSLGKTFIEGESYSNYFGTYTVLSFSDDLKMMTVRYDVAEHMVRVGQIVEYKVASQAETIYKQERRDKVALAHARGRVKVSDLSETDDFTLLWIAENGRIDVSCASASVDNFRAYYRITAGHEADDHKGHGFTPVAHEDRWGTTMVVDFPMPDEDGLKALRLPEEGVHVDGNHITISNNAFVRGLFERGFHIGRNNENAALSAK